MLFKIESSGLLKIEKSKMTEQYKDERQPPTVPHCGIADFSLEFNGHYLYLRNYKVGADFVSFAYPTVSGKSIDGKFIYTAERQKLKNIGPIPEGIYWIKPSEIQNNAWYRFNYNSAAWGKHWLTIHLLEVYEHTCKRSFFYPRRDYTSLSRVY